MQDAVRTCFERFTLLSLARGEYEPDHSPFEECLSGLHLPLVVLGEAPIPAQPPESPLYEEANRLVPQQALDSRQVPEGGEGMDQATLPVMPEASRLVVRIRSSGKPTLLS